MLKGIEIRYLFFVFIPAVICMAAGGIQNAPLSAGAPSMVDTSEQTAFAGLAGSWQLLADDYLVAKKEHIKRTYHPFIKHAGNPLLIADKPWEGRMAYVFGTVLPNEKEKGYRLWYQSWAGEYADLYATSKDGLTWEKPELGIVDYKGSKANNIFLRRTKEDVLPQVIYTPWEKDSNRRYKLLNYDYGRTRPDHLIRGYWGAYSPDGIHWTDVAHNPVLKDPGDVGQFVWDDHTHRYIGFPKIFAIVRGFRRRCVGFTATKDFEHWPSTRLIMMPDKADDHWVTQPGQRTEFYGLSAFPYESGYLGFLWIFHITDAHDDGPIYCELASSRDGIHWVREETVNGERIPILPVGPRGSWDQGMIFTPNHPLVENNTIKLWYGGCKQTHGAPEDSAKAAIGLATLRKDGFVSLDADETIGIVTTRSLKNLHQELLVNANAGSGSLKVEVLDENGNVLPGYSAGECHIIRSDGTALPVSWQKHKHLPDLHAGLRLRFILQHAELYSFMGGAGVDLLRPERPEDKK